MIAELNGATIKRSSEKAIGSCPKVSLSLMRLNGFKITSYDKHEHLCTVNNPVTPFCQYRSVDRVMGLLDFPLLDVTSVKHPLRQYMYFRIDLKRSSV
ncbi:hypothetical protein PsorP6_009808 [Peronosclerospora sorghi]|uniref:Uncharacterized protein n=1 Tax=Peronosclerospora sorghi TaxID=230839 RepID=A0ACC0VX69_9STRA|nr:hypothetical protein PsorP6_009808 [Peronosclerospora sorghi]